MQTAQTLPRSVGVAPGTTTLVLSGPTVGCENPARVARQRQMLYPPGKVNVGLPPMPASWQAGPTATTAAAAATATRPPRAGGTQAVEAVRNAVTRVQNVLDPYGTIESLKGVIASRETRLGLVLAPEGNRSPYPSSEIVAVGKTTAGPSAYCTRRPERGPNFRESQTWQYESNRHLGAVPTDLQLATQRGYTPVFSQWAPGKTGAYSPLPWIPPTGSPRSTLPGDPPGYVQGYMTQLAGPRLTMLGADGEPTATSPLAPSAPAATPEYNAGQAAVEELKRHQDRMYSLGILSAAAVAMTAMVNVFRYMDDKRTARKRTKTAVAAEPAPALSGRRLRRR